MTSNSVKSLLRHQTIYEDKLKIAVSLPLTDNLKSLHINGTFPLMEDPLVQKSTTIIGMFVLRPKILPWVSPIIQAVPESETPVSVSHSMFDLDDDWNYSCAGLEGGWLIADGNLLDPFRLGLQYGISDAVIIGSRTVSDEGCDRTLVDGSVQHGYLWQPYGPCSWPHVAAVDNTLIEKILEQRALLQSLGYLSARKYPATIIVTTSGEHYPGGCDILAARALHAFHPNGERIEVYILTSNSGCQKIRNRVVNYPDLIPRINDILIELSPENQPDVIELKKLPSLLFSKFDIRIANNDGGKELLQKCVEAQIISQMNLTLCRKKSLYQVIETHTRLANDVIDETLKNFDERVKEFSFFSSFVDASDKTTCYTGNGTASSDGNSINISNDGKKLRKGIPRSFVPVSVITDDSEDVAVVTFDVRGLKSF